MASSLKTVAAAASHSLGQAKIAGVEKKVASAASLQVVPRRSKERGHNNMGWLNTYHTLNFAGYYDRRFQNFNSLRVLNEDRVWPGQGFGRHPHREFEIFSYVVKGSLLHKDSMGNSEVIKRSMVQFTSAGTGISHSEFNGSDKDLVHFLQIWAKPAKYGLKPSYQTATFPDSEKQNKLRLIISPDGAEGSITIHQDLKLFASLLEPGKRISLPVVPNRDYYVHVIQDATSFDSEANRVALDLSVGADGSTKLLGGDGAFLAPPTQTTAEPPADEQITFESVGQDTVEFLVFDLAREKRHPKQPSHTSPGFVS